MIYRLYPTLLNSFNLYASQSRDGNGKIIVDEIELIDRINRGANLLQACSGIAH